LTLAALYPFHRNAAGDFWTSASVRDHTIFGSTYPEFLGLSATDTLIGRVNALYGENATSRFSWETAGTELHIASLQSSDVQYQYSAVVRAQQMGPGGVSKVLVFLDANMEIKDRSPGTQKWMSEPGFVGYAGFQNAIGAETEMKTNGVVALTAALEDRIRTGELRSMDEATVGAYLQEKLYWLLVDVRSSRSANLDRAFRALLTRHVRPMTMPSLLRRRPDSRLGYCGRG
jgi:tyrosinase